MKAALGASVDRFFSFAPSEIARFIRPVANRPHTIDVAAGKQVWDSVRVAFDDRLTFARMMVERIDAGHHDIEVGPCEFALARTSHYIVWDLVNDAAGPRTRIGRLVDALGARSRSSEANQSRAAARPRRPVAIPTDADFASVCERHSGSAIWNAAGDEWECTVCARDKRRICRKSNNGKWTAAIHYLQAFEEERDPENQLRRRRHHFGAILLSTNSRYTVCQDCRHIVTEAIKLVPGSDEHCLRPEDLRALIGDAEPHRLHDVSSDAIRGAVGANREWIAAVADYWAHRNEAIGVSSHISSGITRGYDPDHVRRAVFDHYRTRYTSFDQPHFSWLEGEGRRLSGQ